VSRVSAKLFMGVTMATDKTSVAEKLDDVCDSLFGYTAENANIPNMKDEDFGTLMAGMCEALGIEEPADSLDAPRDAAKLVDYFIGKSG
jgi:hypothetical protein